MSAIASSASMTGARTRGVSVCICTRNRPESLALTLQSLTRSTLAVQQVVVSDDSTDESTAAMIAADHPGVVYLRGPRRGLGANRNAIVSRAEHELVLFLDDDCLLDPRFLERTLGQLDALADQDRVIVSGRELRDGVLVEANDQSFLGFQNRPYRAGDRRCSVVINAALFPRELFDDVAFDEQLIYGYDEIDVTTRAVARGYTIVECAEAVNHHHPSPANRDYYGEHANWARIYVTFNRYRATDRRPVKAVAFIVAAAGHVLASLVRRDGVRGVAHAAATMTDALRAIARRPVGAHRRGAAA